MPGFRGMRILNAVARDYFGGGVFWIQQECGPHACPAIQNKVP